MTVATYSDIIKFLVAVAEGGVPLTSVVAGSYFVWAGATFTKTAVTACALGLAAPLILVGAGLAMIGAGIWLAFVKK